MGSEQYVLAIIGLLRILKDKKILELKLENNFQIPKIPIFTISVPLLSSTYFHHRDPIFFFVFSFN